MTARRKVATVAALGLGPLALVSLATAPAVAHGSLTDPVSRVSACFAEGPENPQSAACKAAVAASGTQAFYDWNEVNIADAAGNHQQLIPDGKLCSAGREKYQGLDLPRADWPSSPLTAGNRTFQFKATAPHKGKIQLFITKDGYDPAKPLKWSDLETKPIAETVVDSKAQNGAYTFDGVVPDKSGRHLIYTIWQRSDSPEAFYACSDVVFGKDSGGGAPAPTASAPSDAAIEAGTDKSTVSHGGHGGDEHAGHEGHGGKGADGAEQPAKEAGGNAVEPKSAEEPASANAPEAAGGDAGTSTASDEELAATGGDSSTTYMAAGGAAALAVGAAALFGLGRRRSSAAGGRHSR